MNLALTASDWLTLLTDFMALSLLAVGGAITTVPDMQRTLVNQHQWLTDGQFNASIAIAQAAPGPNVLFVALMGWHIGLNAGGGLGAGWTSWLSALLGVAVSMLGILLPSTTLTFVASRWAHQNRELRAVRAFKQGLAPVVVALLMATGWILSTAQGSDLAHWPLWLLTCVVAVLVWRTQLHLLWLLGAGAVAGAVGWV
ncbi:MAG: chromate transporter [Comamonadaceae bacterium]|nr:MAG: chromate transporter [Comamonadaceae bacterium]